jgi:hypothetical protein
MEVDLQINTNKTNYMLLSRQQNTGQYHNKDNKSFENVAQFKYLEITVTNQNLTQKEIKKIEFG